MRYHYSYRNVPADYFRFYLANVYKNWTGIINVIFTAAFLALMISRWGEAGIPGRAGMIFGFLLFPVFQPLALWLRSVRSAENVTVETELTFSEQELMIRVPGHEQRIPWEKFYRGRAAVRLSGLLVLIPNGMHAYLIPDRVTGAEREELFHFIEKMIRRHSSAGNDGNA